MIEHLTFAARSKARLEKLRFALNRGVISIAILL